MWGAERKGKQQKQLRTRPLIGERTSELRKFEMIATKSANCRVRNKEKREIEFSDVYF